MAEFLEKWYTENKRRMNNDEIKQVAQILEIPESTVRQLEDLFLEKKKLQN